MTETYLLWVKEVTEQEYDNNLKMFLRALNMVGK